MRFFLIILPILAYISQTKCGHLNNLYSDLTPPSSSATYNSGYGPGFNEVSAHGGSGSLTTGISASNSHGHVLPNAGGGGYEGGYGGLVGSSSTGGYGGFSTSSGFSAGSGFSSGGGFDSGSGFSLGSSEGFFKGFGGNGFGSGGHNLISLNEGNSIDSGFKENYGFGGSEGGNVYKGHSFGNHISEGSLGVIGGSNFGGSHTNREPGTIIRGATYSESIHKINYPVPRPTLVFRPVASKGNSHIPVTLFKPNPAPFKVKQYEKIPKPIHVTVPKPSPVVVTKPYPVPVPTKYGVPVPVKVHNPPVGVSASFGESSGYGGASFGLNLGGSHFGGDLGSGHFGGNDFGGNQGNSHFGGNYGGENFKDKFTGDYASGFNHGVFSTGNHFGGNYGGENFKDKFTGDYASGFNHGVFGTGNYGGHSSGYSVGDSTYSSGSHGYYSGDQSHGFSPEKYATGQGQIQGGQSSNGLYDSNGGYKY